MRFQLFKCEITQAYRKAIGFLIASDQQRASEIVVANENELKQENRGFTLERVDEALPADQRLGLDELLESATAGFVSFCPGVGWISQAKPASKLRFYLIESADGGEAQVIAPNADVAAAIWLSSLDLGDDGTHPMWSISAGLNDLDERQHAEIEHRLEFGPVGMVAWDDERGWSLV